MAILFSASNAMRAMSCSGSVTLPQSPNTTNEAAEMGTIVHAFLDSCWAMGREDALAFLEGCKGHTACKRIDVEAIWDAVGTRGADVSTELCFEYNTRTQTALALFDVQERNYPDNADCVYGTVDLLINGKELSVWDYKTGKNASLEREMPQLRMLGLMAARCFNRDEVRVGVVLLPDRGEHATDSVVMGAMDLDAFEDEVLTAASEIKQARLAVAAGRTPVLNPGPQCRYCRSVGCEARISI